MSVRTTRLRSILSESEYSSYETMLEEIRHSEEILYDEMPELLKTYNKKLNKADLMNDRYEKMAGTNAGTSTSRTKVSKQAEKLYEEALEYLEEQYGCVDRGDYGADIGKGKFAVEVGTEKDLVKVLDVIKTVVSAGELDTAIENAATKLRDGFTK